MVPGKPRLAGKAIEFAQTSLGTRDHPDGDRPPNRCYRRWMRELQHVVEGKDLKPVGLGE